VSWTFSRRLEWSSVENSLAEAETRARARPGLIDLTVSNPTLPGLGLPDMTEALTGALGQARAGRYEPAPRGGESARQAIAATYRAAQHPIDAENIVVTASSSESYSWLFKLLGDPGDVVLVPAPSYPLFDYLVRLEGLTPLPYRSSYEATGRWHIDLDSVDRAWATANRDGRRVCAVVVVSPNNPTGAVLDEDEAAALDARCATHGAALIADEVFRDFIRRPSPRQVGCLAARPTQVPTFSLGGLSKSCGLPQLKVGWIVLGGPTALVSAARARLELIADTYLSVNALALEALPDLLRLGAETRTHLTARLRENEAQLAGALGPRSPISLLRSDGGWLAIVRLPATQTDEAWAMALIERDGVLVQPGFFFDLEGGAFLILSLLPEPRAFATGVERLTARVESATDDRSG
jgi:hypothetical protein